MSEETRRQVARRIGEYSAEQRLASVEILFHGGEPLLAGADWLAGTTRIINENLPPTAKAKFALQTNGVLLTPTALTTLATAGIRISISIDGPETVHDLHRLDHKGRSTFGPTLRALSLLEQHPAAFAGIIAVIDPAVPPADLFAFFAPRRPPRIDFLLPDAHHDRQPPGRDADPECYTRWLLHAFDLWLDHYPMLPVRTFDAIFAAVAGQGSTTDAFGFGDVSLLTIETDGSYHDLDVLKITTHGATALNMHVSTHTIADAARSPRIHAHRQRLQFTGLSTACQACPIVQTCGGGAVPHRYKAGSYGQPSVYCQELYSLITHARTRLQDLLSEHRNTTATRTPPFSLHDFEDPDCSNECLDQLIDDWSATAAASLTTVLRELSEDSQYRTDAERIINSDPARLRKLTVQPGIVLWTNIMTARLQQRTIRATDGQPIIPDPSYLRTIAALLDDDAAYPRIQREDPWLRLAFGTHIAFDDTITSQGTALVADALGIIGGWRPALLAEIQRLNPDIQFIRDDRHDAANIISFSDDATPGALYIGLRTHDGLIASALLAESIIHEHRHQKLYLLQRQYPLVTADHPLVPSPWKTELRPPNGVFHSVFVFTQIHDYWRDRARNGDPGAATQAEQIREKISRAIPTLYATHLTATGRALLQILENRIAIAP